LWSAHICGRGHRRFLCYYFYQNPFNPHKHDQHYFKLRHYLAPVLVDNRRNSRDIRVLNFWILFMKTRFFQISLLTAAAALVFAAGRVSAQISTVSAQPAVAGQSAPQLSYGVPQVMQLVQAKISDSVIVNYIQSSSTIYSLSADEIVYLKQQGVSDNVLNAMLNQRGRVSGYTQPAAMTASANSVPATSTTATSDQSYTAAAPPVTYVQQAAQPSTVYVVPNTQTYYYSYPYYSVYYYGWPAISLSFGYYGGSYCSGSYYHGGYYGGSSWHGSSGGSWHGSSGGGWHGGGVSWHGGGGGGGHH
jgi:hypothetical protein